MTLTQKLNKAFDILWEQADAILKEFGPCNHETVNGKHQCLAKKTGYDLNGCCEGCGFLTNKGCIANKPLSCKVWLCWAAKFRHPQTYKKLEAIKRVAINFYLIGDNFHETHRKEKMAHIIFATKQFACRRQKLYYKSIIEELDSFIKT